MTIMGSKCPLQLVIKPLLKTGIEVLHLFRCFTHTPHRSGETEAPTMRWRWGWQEMKMRWRCKWDESYLTRTPRGERKRREEGENTNTNTPGPERANPEKAREKKSGGRRAKTNRPAEGGEDRSAWTNLTKRNLTPTWEREGPKPT